MRSKRMTACAALLAVAAVSLVVAAGCGGDDDEETVAGVIAAVSILDGAGLHGIDESINTRGEIPATALATAEKLQVTVLLTSWPEEMQAEAKVMADVFAEMAKALGGEKPDPKVAGPAATKAHDAEHELSEKAWDYLKKRAKVGGGAASSHQD